MLNDTFDNFCPISGGAILEVILADLGQNLAKARSGEEALRQLLDTDFAVILLDVKMEGLDGLHGGVAHPAPVLAIR